MASIIDSTYRLQRHLVRRSAMCLLLKKLHSLQHLAFVNATVQNSTIHKGKRTGCGEGDVCVHGLYISTEQSVPILNVFHSVRNM